MLILGIETTCDETGVAILDAQGGKKNPSFSLLSNEVFSQIKDHASFGGVVPNLAGNLHLKNISLVLKKALHSARVSLEELDLISVAYGPGLAPALFVGVETAKTISFLTKKPILGVNHLEGHIYINWLFSGRTIPNFPLLALLISGGHTMLIYSEDFLSYKLLGQTKDDAVGESFDKVARLLGLGYPGGPFIESLASKYQGKLIPLPRPMINDDSFDFSFSGLKTAVFYSLKEKKGGGFSEKFRQQMSASFQEAVIDSLLTKSLRAVEGRKVNSFILGGGVSANKTLVKRFSSAFSQKFPKINFYNPSPDWATDNGAMIAIAGYFNFLNKKSDKKRTDFRRIIVRPNLSLV